jgi:hypothetical protein
VVSTQPSGFKGALVVVVGKMSAAEDEEASRFFGVELLTRMRGKVRERGSTRRRQLSFTEAKKKRGERGGQLRRVGEKEEGGCLDEHGAWGLRGMMHVLLQTAEGGPCTARSGGRRW